MNTDQIFSAIEEKLVSMERTKTWLSEQLGVTTQVLNNWRTRGIPKNRLRSIAEAFGWSETELARGHIVPHEDRLEIPMHELATLAGNRGQINNVISLTLSKRWAEANIPCTNISNLRLIPGAGNAMQPTYTDGDTLVLDTGSTTLQIDGVYALVMDNEVIVKRLERMLIGAIQVSSDNKDYKAYTIEKGDLASIQILGRVTWVFQGRVM